MLGSAASCMIVVGVHSIVDTAAPTLRCRCSPCFPAVVAAVVDVDAAGVAEQGRHNRCRR